jgi:hypothetical protein
MKQDLFSSIKELSCVTRISNFFPEENQIFDFIFFVCPRFSGSGLKINKHQTGFTANYREGISEYSKERFKMVKNFIDQINTIGINYTVNTVFAAADSMLLFPLPPEPPITPHGDDIPKDFELISNLNIYRDHFQNFSQIYRQEPWKSAPNWALKIEYERLAEIIPSHAPENIKQDFISRCFAGFALDGIILRKGLFGSNPVLLGVESKGVSVLQNCALERKDWLPVIDLG